MCACVPRPPTAVTYSTKNKAMHAPGELLLSYILSYHNAGLTHSVTRSKQLFLYFNDEVSCL